LIVTYLVPQAVHPEGWNGEIKCNEESSLSAATKKDIVSIEPELSDGDINSYYCSPEEFDVFTNPFELQ